MILSTVQRFCACFVRQLMPEVPREILSSRKVEPPRMLGPWLNSIEIQRIYIPLIQISTNISTSEVPVDIYWHPLICHGFLDMFKHISCNFHSMLSCLGCLQLPGWFGFWWTWWKANEVLFWQNHVWRARSRSIDVAEGGCGCLPFYGHEAIGGTLGSLGGSLTIPQLEWDALGSEVPDVSAFPFRMVFKNVRRLPAQREGHHQLHAEQVCKAVWMWIDDRWW